MTDHDTIASQLAEIVGATHVSSAPADVDAYGGLEPLLVVWPGAASEVARVLRTCTELGVAVGVSACGTRATRHWPVPDDRPRIALDTRRMLNILEVDELSLTVHSQCGIKLVHLEQALNRHGLTLGAYPALIQRHTLGGILAAPHPMAHSPGSGWLTEACMGVSVANADGTVMHTRIAPRKATGPDMARLYLGSHGSLGVITTAVLRVHRQPEQEVVRSYTFPDMAQSIEAARGILARGARPARLRVLGKEQALVELEPSGVADSGAPVLGSLRESPGHGSGALLLVLAGPAALVAAEQRLADEAATAAGGRELSLAVGSRWWAREAGAATESLPVPVGARVCYADSRLMLASVPGSVQRRKVLVWAEEFTLQGFTLWTAFKEVNNRPTQQAALMRSALLDAGLDPLRPDFPPLLDELRQLLDPTQTLVVMEA